MGKSPVPTFIILAAVLLGSIATGAAVISTHQPSVTAASTLPDPPTRITATAVSATAVYLTWMPPANTGGLSITKYEVYRSSIAGAEFYIGDSTTTNYKDTSLVSGIKEYYKITTRTSAGEGGNRSR